MQIFCFLSEISLLNVGFNFCLCFWESNSKYLDQPFCVSFSCGDVHKLLAEMGLRPSLVWHGTASPVGDAGQPGPSQEASILPFQGLVKQRPALLQLCVLSSWGASLSWESRGSSRHTEEPMAGQECEHGADVAARGRQPCSQHTDGVSVYVHTNEVLPNIGANNPLPDNRGLLKLSVSPQMSRHGLPKKPYLADKCVCTQIASCLWLFRWQV